MLQGQQNESKGILLKVLSGLCFSLMGGLIKSLDNQIPLGELVFFRSFIALLPLVIFLKWTSDFPAGLHTKHPLKHIARCVLGTLAMFCSFKALAFLPLAEHTALFYLSPIFLVIFAMIFLKEQVSFRRWVGVGFGVAGLAVLTVPNFSLGLSVDANLPFGISSSLLGIGLAVMSAVLAAAALLQVRQLTQMGENAGAIAFYFAITSSVMGGLVMLGHWSMPTIEQSWCLLAIGLFGGAAQILMTLAFKYAEASALAPYDYLAIVWAVIIGFLAFAELPDVVFWLAMPLIIVGAVVAKPKAVRKKIK